MERKGRGHYVVKGIYSLLPEDNIKKLPSSRTPRTPRTPTPSSNTDTAGIKQIQNPIATPPVKNGGTRRRKSRKNKTKRNNKN